MIKIYGSHLCPNCRAFLKHLDLHHLPYEFIDINESLDNLKQFLKHRDFNPIFDECKEINRIGIPAFYDENTELSIDWIAYLENHNIQIEETE